jgi:hypothetical protein
VSKRSTCSSPSQFCSPSVSGKFEAIFYNLLKLLESVYIHRIAFAWFTTFVFLSVIPITFEEKKGWSHGIAGLPYIALCIGVCIAFGINFISER